MNRSLLVVIAFALTSAACETRSTFTRTCYEVPDSIVEVRGDTTVTATGIKYIDRVVGAGAEAVECADVTVRYSGELLDGSQFDDGTFLFVPGASQVIRGFEQGVIGMRVDGNRRFLIPPELGYGAEPQRDPATGDVLIPANSTLVFDVEVLAVSQ